MHLDHSKTTLKPRFKFKPDFRIRATVFGQRSGSGVSGLPECQSDTSYSQFRRPHFQLSDSSRSPRPRIFMLELALGAPPPPPPHPKTTPQRCRWLLASQHQTIAARWPPVLGPFCKCPPRLKSQWIATLQFRCRIILVNITPQHAQSHTVESLSVTSSSHSIELRLATPTVHTYKWSMNGPHTPIPLVYILRVIFFGHPKGSAKGFFSSRISAFLSTKYFEIQFKFTLRNLWIWY